MDQNPRILPTLVSSAGRQRRDVRTLGFATVLMTIAAMPAAAPDFSTRPLTLVVSYAAGLPPDVARITQRTDRGETP